jgi:cytochrome c-type biogenesis protein CcmH/NrfG
MSQQDSVADIMASGDWPRAEALARSMTQAQPNAVDGWRWLGVALQAQGRSVEAFDAFEAALRLAPEDDGVAAALAQTAVRLGMRDAALALTLHVAERRPVDPAATVALCDVLLSMDRTADARGVISDALERHPDNLDLVHAAGRVCRALGRLDDAATLFNTVRAERPKDARLLYDLAWTQADAGALEASLATCDASLAAGAGPETAAAVRFLKSTVRLALGRLEEGWRDYAARNDPDLPAAPVFEIPGSRWDGTSDLTGAHLVCIAEQGLGDEIAFLGLTRDLFSAVGPEGTLTLSADPRLHGLIQRRWPTVGLVATKTQSLNGRRVRRLADPVANESIWAPIGDFLQGFRSDIERFKRTAPYLAPDLARVADWRRWLATLPPGPRIGLTWRSGRMLDGRSRNFAELADWRPVITAHADVCFIALQYGQSEEEIAKLVSGTGTSLHTPPGLDLFHDLDGLAALMAALDLTIGFSNATTNLAGAVGAPLWLITPPAPWTALGAPNYPWYPQAKRFTAEDFADWSGVMRDVASALATLDG